MMATAMVKRISALEKVIRPREISVQESNENLLRHYGVTMEEVNERYGGIPAFCYAIMCERKPTAEDEARSKAGIEKYGSAQAAYMAMLNG
jgi:hypothetical protein